MSESSSIEVNGGQLQDFTIDQFAGATALILGSFGGLLMIIWKSRCACKVRLGMTDNCVCFECSRTPPPDDDDSDDDGKDPKKVKDKKKEKPKKKPNIQLIPETTNDNQQEDIDLENNANQNNP
tara:strand:- start:291 stop:662 length:372 start_codon:yes stop_codon:yes gene_type:complete